jgi:ribosome-binding protein aMBF1 (putative translation factor)
MGHYCRICGRTRANEKFSGKGHKNHVCKDCSGKSSKKAKEYSFNENAYTPENMVPLSDVRIQSEDICFDDTWFSEIDFEKRSFNDKNDEELPF